MRRLVALLLLFMPFPATAQEIDAVVMIADDGTRTLVHELMIPARPEAIWEAIGTVEGWRTWATPMVRDVPNADRFETSYNPEARPGGPDTIEHQWIVREPPHRLSFRTTRTPEGFPHAEAYRRTYSTFTLLPEGAGTRVRLTHAGFAADPAGDALLGFFREGNGRSLRQLHRRFIDGPINWQAANPDP